MWYFPTILKACVSSSAWMWSTQPLDSLSIGMLPELTFWLLALGILRWRLFATTKQHFWLGTSPQVKVDTNQSKLQGFLFLYISSFICFWCHTSKYSASHHDYQGRFLLVLPFLTTSWIHLPWYSTWPNSKGAPSTSKLFRIKEKLYKCFN